MAIDKNDNPEKLERQKWLVLCITLAPTPSMYPRTLEAQMYSTCGSICGLGLD